MKRGMFNVVAGMLMMLIGAGPACACVAGGMVAKKGTPAVVAAAPVASDGAATAAMEQDDHSCCMASDTSAKPVKPAAESHDASCPQCQVMTNNVKTVQDHQALASLASLHFVAIVPAMLGVPAVGALHVAVLSPVWSPPPMLADLFHTFCLLTL